MPRRRHVFSDVCSKRDYVVLDLEFDLLDAGGLETRVLPQQTGGLLRYLAGFG